MIDLAEISAKGDTYPGQRTRHHEQDIVGRQPSGRLECEGPLGIGVEYRKAFAVDDASDEGEYACAVLNSTLARCYAGGVVELVEQLRRARSV